MAIAGSVAIVTGGAQGIGAAISRALLKQGCKVCVADIQEDKGRNYVEELQETYGYENVIFSYCDVTKQSFYERTFENSLNAFRKVDILVNNAGIFSEQDPQAVIAVNLMGPLLGCQTALKYMGKANGGKGGIVINTSSLWGLLPGSIAPAYTAAKHGVLGLTRSYGLPSHLEKHGIIFAAFCPSQTDTDILKSVITNALFPGVDYRKRPGLMSPDFVAEAVLKLLEDRINGSVLLVTKEKGYQYIGYQEELKDIEIS